MNIPSQISAHELAKNLVPWDYGTAQARPARSALSRLRLAGDDMKGLFCMRNADLKSRTATRKNEEGKSLMKSLYASFMLWMIRPALSAGVLEILVRERRAGGLLSELNSTTRWRD
jgi:hypothetical protein